MVKVRRIAGKAVSLILAVTMFASLIDIRAFADAGAVVDAELALIPKITARCSTLSNSK